MQGSFGSFTVNIDAHALNLNNQYLTLLYVYKPVTHTHTSHFLYHHTSWGVANVHDKFQGVTVDVHTATEFLRITT